VEAGAKDEDKEYVQLVKHKENMFDGTFKIIVQFQHSHQEMKNIQTYS